MSIITLHISTLMFVSTLEVSFKHKYKNIHLSIIYEHKYVFFLDKRRFCFSESGSHGFLLKAVFRPTVTKRSDFFDCLCVIVGSLPYSVLRRLVL